VLGEKTFEVERLDHEVGARAEWRSGGRAVKLEASAGGWAYCCKRWTRREVARVVNLEKMALTSSYSRLGQAFSPHGIEWLLSLSIASSSAP
jgi:hypothetical protein